MQLFRIGLEHFDLASRRGAASALALFAVATGIANAQDGPKARSASTTESEIAKYCGNIAPAAAEARVAGQTARLVQLETEIKREISELERRQADARDWVSKREQLMKSASDDVVAIYAKMTAESAASQIATMDEAVAAGVLAKLAPRVASAILGEMEATKAAKLTSLMMGAPAHESRS